MRDDEERGIAERFKTCIPYGNPNWIYCFYAPSFSNISKTPLVHNLTKLCNYFGLLFKLRSMPPVQSIITQHRWGGSERCVSHQIRLEPCPLGILIRTLCSLTCLLNPEMPTECLVSLCGSFPSSVITLNLSNPELSHLQH